MKKKKQHKINYNDLNNIHTKTFREIIYKKFTGYSLIPILVVISVIMVLYFMMLKMSENGTIKVLLDTVMFEMEQLTNKNTENVNEIFKDISNLTELLGKDTKRIIENSTVTSLPYGAPEFEFDEKGFFYKKTDNSGVSLYYSSLTDIGEYEYEKALKTEGMDSLLKLLVEQYPEIVASYFNTYDGMNRYYPFMPKEFWMGEVKMTEYNFYYEADKVHNPSKGTTWTGTYLDPAGQGWLISCIYPVYTNRKISVGGEDFLEGVVGLDITVENILNHILNFDLPWKGYAFIIDEDGMIIAMDEGVEGILNINADYYEMDSKMINPDTFQSGKLNLFENADLKGFFNKDLISNESFGVKEYSLNEKSYMMSHSKVEETGWDLFLAVSKESILTPVAEVIRNNNFLSTLVFSTLLPIILGFLIYMFKGSKKVSENVVLPIVKMTQITSEIMENGVYSTRVPRVQIKELDVLAENFNKMTEEMEKIYRNLEGRIERSIKEIRDKDHMMIHQSRLAAMGEMIGNIAHQWRQPLNSIGLIVQEIEDAYEYGELNENRVKESVERVLRLLDFMSHTIDDFRNFFSKDKSREEFHIINAIERSVSFIETSLKNYGVDLKTDYSLDSLITGYPNEFAQVLLNILNNALESIIESERRDPCIKIKVDKTGNFARITVCDNGKGIETENLEKIFEPYFTTKKKGTGLGLYIARIIVEKNMKGRIFSAGTESGACITIEIPVEVHEDE